MAQTLKEPQRAAANELSFDQRACFIAGQAKSGTTLLVALLDFARRNGLLSNCSHEIWEALAARTVRPSNARFAFECGLRCTLQVSIRSLERRQRFTRFDGASVRYNDRSIVRNGAKPDNAGTRHLIALLIVTAALGLDRSVDINAAAVARRGVAMTVIFPPGPGPAAASKSSSCPNWG